MKYHMPYVHVVISITSSFRNHSLIGVCSCSMYVHIAHSPSYLKDDQVDTKAESSSDTPPHIAALQKLEQAMAKAETSRAPAPLELALENAVAARTAIVSSSVGPKQERQARVQMLSKAIKRAHSLLDQLEEEGAEEAEHGENPFQSWHRRLLHT